MLQNDFFTIISRSREGDVFRVSLEINATHPIFEGHFPGQPVVPGACLMQMVKEITETITGGNLQLNKAGQIKFIAMIDPNENNKLEMQLSIKTDEEGGTVVTANLLNNGSVCFRFDGLFQLLKSAQI
jgi:3-hydroxyacyl-[acyl-carrier-protein] dehydratase